MLARSPAVAPVERRRAANLRKSILPALMPLTSLFTSNPKRLNVSRAAPVIFPVASCWKVSIEVRSAVPAIVPRIIEPARTSSMATDSSIEYPIS